MFGVGAASGDIIPMEAIGGKDGNYFDRWHLAW